MSTDCAFTGVDDRQEITEEMVSFGVRQRPEEGKAMRRMIGIAIGLALIACTAFGQRKGSADSTDRKLKEKIDRLAARTVVKGGPGFSIAVVKDQKVILCEAYGVANVESGTPMTAATALNIGSVSKHFTSWAILLLEQRGQLSTADDIHKYLPELPDYGSPLTISHLLYQTSGLPEQLKLLKYAGLFPFDYRRFADVYEILEGGASLEFPPGSQWSYSNTNYALLAEIVQRRSGKRFDDFLRENLFEPLSMDRTVIPSSNLLIVKDRAESYWENNGPLEKYNTTAYIPGPTLVYTSAADMARWMMNFKNNKIGGAGLFDRLCAKGKLNSGEEVWYSMGIARGQYRGKATVGHAGQDGGFVAEMTYCPEFDLGVAVMGNSLSFDPVKVRDAVLDLVIFGETALKAETRQAPAAEVVTPEKVKAFQDRLIGNYTADGSGDIISVFRDGEGLWGNYLGQGNVQLIVRDDSSTTNEERDIVLRVLDLKDGAADKVELDLKGTILKAARIPANPREAEVLDGVAGSYYSPVLGTVYSIVKEGGGLKVKQRRSVGTHDLAYAGKNTLLCSLGELRLGFDDAGKVSRFTLWHETVGGIPFVRIRTDAIL